MNTRRRAIFVKAAPRPARCRRSLALRAPASMMLLLYGFALEPDVDDLPMLVYARTQLGPAAPGRDNFRARGCFK